MPNIERREFLKAAAITAGGAALGAGGVLAGTSGAPSRLHAAQQANRQYKLFSYHTLPEPRPAVGAEHVFTCPFPRANGMQATPEGLWFVDPSNEASHVYLLSYTGQVIRHFPTEGVTPSGMTSDGPTLWLASTYSREIIRVDAMTGVTISKHFTPGAGVIYRSPGDPEARRTPLQAIRNPEAAATGAPAPARQGGQGGRGGQGQSDQDGRGGGGGSGQNTPGRPADGTGGHGMEFRDGKLWLATPPSRMIYRIDPNTWTVEHVIPSVHKRPHGIAFQGDFLWESDADVGVFYKRDPETGLVHEAIQLAADHPTPHGMTIWDGYIWWVDDVQNNAQVWRVRI